MKPYHVGEFPEGKMKSSVRGEKIPSRTFSLSHFTDKNVRCAEFIFTLLISIDSSGIRLRVTLGPLSPLPVCPFSHQGRSL